MLTNSPVHAIVPTHDLATSRPFYEDTLGLKVLEEMDPEAVLLEAGDGTMLLLYRTQVDIPAAHTVCAFLTEELTQRVADLEAHDVSFQEYDMSEYGFDEVSGKRKIVETPDGQRAAWFTDPEGNIIGLYERPAGR